MTEHPILFSAPMVRAILAERDHARLKTLLQKVHAFMADGQYHTLESIKLSCGGTEASVSARLRDLASLHLACISSSAVGLLAACGNIAVSLCLIAVAQ